VLLVEAVGVPEHARLLRPGDDGRGGRHELDRRGAVDVGGLPLLDRDVDARGRDEREHGGAASDQQPLPHFDFTA
jgi:hypothetical protein